MNEEIEIINLEYLALLPITIGKTKDEIIIFGWFKNIPSCFGYSYRCVHEVVVLVKRGENKYAPKTEMLVEGTHIVGRKGRIKFGYPSLLPKNHEKLKQMIIRANCLAKKKRGKE